MLFGIILYLFTVLVLSFLVYQDFDFDNPDLKREVEQGTYLEGFLPLFKENPVMTTAVTFLVWPALLYPLFKYKY